MPGGRQVPPLVFGTWDAATRNHYRLADVRELDRAWRSWHKVAALPPARSDAVVSHSAQVVTAFRGQRVANQALR